MDEEKDKALVLNAIGRAQDVLRDYIEPGDRDPERSLNELLRILDDGEFVEAHERLTWKTKTPRHPKDDAA